MTECNTCVLAIRRGLVAIRLFRYSHYYSSTVLPCIIGCGRRDDSVLFGMMMRDGCDIWGNQIINLLDSLF